MNPWKISMLAFATACVAMPVVADEEQVHALAIETRRAINELGPTIVDPRAMADNAIFEKTTKEIARRLSQWPEEQDSTEKYRPCRNALEKARHVAELTRLKSRSSQDDKAWMRERGQMTRLLAACDLALHFGGIKAA